MRKSTLNKMLALSNINSTNGGDNLPSFDLVKESVNGNTYVISRENKKYYIKESKTTENLKESDFDYVGGVANKAKNNFKSFSEAAKHLNLMFEEINNHYDVENVNILESDSLNEKKYVLKLDKKKSKVEEPKIEEPSTEDEFDFGGEEEATEDDFDFGGESEEEEESFDFETEEGEGEEESAEEESFDFDEEGEGEEEPAEEESFDFETEGGEGEDVEFDDTEDEIRDIQSTTGKLGQQLRDIEDISSDMQKWVAKSVLSALDLDTMDSEDKKDIIKTVKTSEDNGDDSEEEVPSEEMEMEESYDSYMEDDFDGMGDYNWEPTETDNEYDDYDSYMDETVVVSGDQGEEEASEEGNYSPNRAAYESEDKEEDTEIGGDEDDKVAKKGEEAEDKLLLDIEEDEMGPEEMEALYGPKPSTVRKYNRSPYKTAYKQAEKDISKHYHKQSAPGYEVDPVEKWSKHKLPYDTEFMEEGDYMTEDHLNDQMETYEQEKAYEDIEKVMKRYGMGVELRKKETSEDPEESVIYLDIINGDGKKVLVSRINSVGDIEVGEMKGNNFSGEPVDSVEDFIEIFGEDLTKKEKQELEIDMVEDIEMSPAPQRTPDKRPSEPATKPGKPERKSPSERPSRRPFTPPPGITPGEEPAPKAEDEVEFE